MIGRYGFSRVGPAGRSGRDSGREGALSRAGGGEDGRSVLCGALSRGGGEDGRSVRCGALSRAGGGEDGRSLREGGASRTGGGSGRRDSRVGADSRTGGGSYRRGDSARDGASLRDGGSALLPGSERGDSPASRVGLLRSGVRRSSRVGAGIRSTD